MAEIYSFENVSYSARVFFFSTFLGNRGQRFIFPEKVVIQKESEWVFCCKIYSFAVIVGIYISLRNDWEISNWKLFVTLLQPPWSVTFLDFTLSVGVNIYVYYWINLLVSPYSSDKLLISNESSVYKVYNLLNWCFNFEFSSAFYT